MDSDYSDSESVHSTFSESMQTTDLYDTLELGKDPNAYKNNKNCTICGCKFGKIGIRNARKHYCKFCYRGVCATCSPQVAVHPVKHTKLRVCNKCCQTAVINKYTEHFKLDIEVERHRKEGIKKEIEDVQHERIEIEGNIKRSEEDMEEEQRKEIRLVQEQKKILNSENLLKGTQEKQKSLVELNKSASLELDNVNKISRDLTLETEVYTKNKHASELEIRNLKNIMGEKQDDKIILSRNLDEKRAKILEREGDRSMHEKLEKMKTSLSETQTLNFQLSKENDETTKLITKFIDENQDLSQVLMKLKNPPQDKLISSSNNGHSSIEEEKYINLRKRQKDQQIIIENLKIELKKKEPKHIDPMDYEHTNSDKSQRNCVRCNIF